MSVSKGFNSGFGCVFGVVAAVLVLIIALTMAGKVVSRALRLVITTARLEKIAHLLIQERRVTR